MNKKIGLLWTMLCCCVLLTAQEYFPTNGVKDARNGHYLLYNATIVKADGSMLKNGSIEIKEGKIVSVSGSKGSANAAVEVDMAGHYIYPSFVDIYSDYGMPEVKSSRRNFRAPQQMESNNSLTNERENKFILMPQTAHHMSFRKGSSTQAYPGSLMGCQALIKQTYLDGKWYESFGHKEQLDLSLHAWNEVQRSLRAQEMSISVCQNSKQRVRN